MPPEESFYPADWLRIAEKDLGRVERLLSIQDPEAAGFYLQQAVEKFLKAFLLSKGWQLARIHDLEALLNQALTHDPSVEPFRPACQKITGFYMLAPAPPGPAVFRSARCRVRRSQWECRPRRPRRAAGGVRRPRV